MNIKSLYRFFEFALLYSQKYLQNLLIFKYLLWFILFHVATE